MSFIDKNIQPPNLETFFWDLDFFPRLPPKEFVAQEITQIEPSSTSKGEESSDAASEIIPIYYSDKEELDMTLSIGNEWVRKISQNEELCSLLNNFGLHLPEEHEETYLSLFSEAIVKQLSHINIYLPRNLQYDGFFLHLVSGDEFIFSQFLQNAYQYSLVQCFGEKVPIQEADTLEHQANTILDWLKSPENRNSITELYLDGLTIACLPREIGLLTELCILDVSDNFIESLPFELIGLKKLADLRLNNNDLSILPPWIDQLESLVILEVSNNNLTSIPQEIGHLIYLKELTLQTNKISFLPEEIQKLTFLENLWLDNNDLITLPKGIGGLTSLKKLSTINNCITHLPLEIGRLINLKELYLCNNFIEELPAEVEMLKNLETLQVNVNRLTSLPREIKGLINVKIIDISGNALASVPDELKHLTKLQTLIASRNVLLTLPKELERITFLERI